MITHEETIARSVLNDPPIEVNQEWVAKDEDGEVIRILRILAPHPDGGYIFTDLPSKIVKRDFHMRVTPEYNLRRIFELKT